jgi:hypothetical protein
MLVQNISDKTNLVSAPRYRFINDDTVHDGPQKATRYRREWK